MANLQGTLVAAPVLPFSDTDTFPTHYAMYGKGNIHSVPALADRDAISASRREIGMFCYVQEQDILYQLIGGIDNTNWIDFGSKLISNVQMKQSYTHNQIIPATDWIINHNLNRYPSVSVSDSSGNIVFGDIKYNDFNNLTVSFSSEFSGQAYIT